MSANHEYLVTIRNSLPPEMPDGQRAMLVAAEARRAAELAEAGTLRRLWRVAGRRENVGLWVAEGGDDLHRALSSLPMFPYLDITVVALAQHESDPPHRMAAGPGEH